MISRSVRVASVFAAAFCFASLSFAGQAQTNSTPAPSATQQAPSTPSQQSAPPLQLRDLPPDAHTPTPAEEAQQEQQRVLMQVERLANMEAQWGPAASTAGMSIDLKEVGRTKAPDGSTQITWQIAGKGFPAGQKLSLTRWPLDTRPQIVMGGIQFDAQGTAVCVAPPAPSTGANGDTTQGLAAAAKNLSQPDSAPASPAPAAPAPSIPATPEPPACAATIKPGQPVEIQAAVAPGEAVRVALVGQGEKDGKPVRFGAATDLVPFPIESTDQGCTLQVIRGMKNAAMVLVQGTGFPANATLSVDTVTGSQTRAIPAHTNAKGTFVLAALPALEGQNQGDTTVHMGAAAQAPSLQQTANPPPASNCNPSVTFHWGADSYKPQ